MLNAETTRYMTGDHSILQNQQGPQLLNHRRTSGGIMKEAANVASVSLLQGVMWLPAIVITVAALIFFQGLPGSETAYFLHSRKIPLPGAAELPNGNPSVGPTSGTLKQDSQVGPTSAADGTRCGIRRLDKGVSGEAEVAVIIVGGIRKGELTLPSIFKWVLSTPREPSLLDALSPASAPAPAPAGARSPGPASDRPALPWFKERADSPGVLDLFVRARLDQASYKVMGLFPTCFCTSPDASCAELEQDRIPLGHITLSMTKEPPFDSDPYVHPRRFRDIALETLDEYQHALRLVQVHEKEGRGGRPYKWLLKTRPDAYWYGPPPAVARLAVPTGHTAAYWGPNETYHRNYSTDDPRLAQNNFLYIPYGHDCFGYNDRGAIGPRLAMEGTLTPLEHLLYLNNSFPAPTEEHWTPLEYSTSEGVLRSNLEIQRGILVLREIFPFCVLTQHFYVARALNQPHPNVGGAYCRPCTNISEPDRNEWCTAPGPTCAIEEWPSNWEDMFDATVPRDLAGHRQRMAAFSSESCNATLSHIQLLMNSSSSHPSRTYQWEAPPPSQICSIDSLTQNV